MPTSMWIQRLPRRHPGHGPRLFRRGYVAERPAQRSLVGQCAEMTTQTASLVTMDEATSEDPVVAYVEEIIDGTGWHLDRVKRRGNRLEPPDSYWSMFGVDINKDGEERNLRLVARGALNPAAWDQLSGRLMAGGAGLPSDPIYGIGYPRLYPE